MTSFTIQSKDLALVSPINSVIQTVGKIDGVMYFTPASHPSIGIKVTDETAADVIVVGTTIEIKPSGTEGEYILNVLPKTQTSSKKSKVGTTSPSKDFLANLIEF